MPDYSEMIASLRGWLSGWTSETEFSALAVDAAREERRVERLTGAKAAGDPVRGVSLDLWKAALAEAVGSGAVQKKRETVNEKRVTFYRAAP